MRYHFVGIGGSGLSAIARVLLERGDVVSGSDQADSPFLEALRDLGAQVVIGHRPENVKGAEAVVVSSAVREDNVEIRAARALGIPVYKRVDFLGPLTEGKRTIAVAGTHGKTTTTGEIAWILSNGGLDPTFIAGGSLGDFAGANARAGLGDLFVIEADEYDRAFLGLSPWIAIVTNVEHDHPDCYPTLADLHQAFAAFLARVRPDGAVVACADSPGAMKIVAEFAAARPDIQIQTYAVDMEADWQATQILPNAEGGSDFLVVRRGETMGRVRTRLPGMHNVCNSLAALAAADLCGLPFTSVSRSLSRYHGADRRFEVKGTAGGVTVVDDYAHHPSEIRATLAAARMRYPDGRIWAIWQPHTYSRTRALESDFAQAFGSADRVVVLPVYRAREPLDQGFAIEDLVRSIRGTHAEFLPGLDEAVARLSNELRGGDVVITLSAGDANRVGEDVLRFLHQSAAGRRAEGQGAILPMERLQRYFGARLQEDILLSRLTTVKAGGPADALVEITTVEELAADVEFCWSEGIPFILLGSGSNILFSDAGCRELVLLNRAKGFEIRPDASDPESAVVWGASGSSIGAIARQTAQNGWTGLEWAATVPGTVGGAVVGNAGAFGGDTAGSLRLVEILQRKESDNSAVFQAVRKHMEPEDLEFGYRTSLLKRKTGQAVVLSAEFSLKRLDPSEAIGRIGGFLARRKETQPPGASLGSMFKNPPGDSAGRLIEAAGLKGYRQGNVEISQQHANFFLNLGDAKAQEIRDLMDLARRTVREKFGVELEPEIVFMGDWPGGE